MRWIGPAPSELLPPYGQVAKTFSELMLEPRRRDEALISAALEFAPKIENPIEWEAFTQKMKPVFERRGVPFEMLQATRGARVTPAIATELFGKVPVADVARRHPETGVVGPFAEGELVAGEELSPLAKAMIGYPIETAREVTEMLYKKPREEDVFTPEEAYAHAKMLADLGFEPTITIGGKDATQVVGELPEKKPPLQVDLGYVKLLHDWQTGVTTEVWATGLSPGEKERLRREANTDEWERKFKIMKLAIKSAEDLADAGLLKGLDISRYTQRKYEELYMTDIANRLGGPSLSLPGEPAPPTMKEQEYALQIYKQRYTAKDAEKLYAEIRKSAEELKKRGIRADVVIDLIKETAKEIGR